MDGIILFADNKVFENNSFENYLFEKLHSDGDLSVIPISNLEDLKKTIRSISTFKALILDWNFENNDVEDDLVDFGVEKPKSNPESLLEIIEIYSLIYVYSQIEIAREIQDKLINRFHEKIKFKIKGDKKDSDNEYQTIKKDIIEFEQTNKQMGMPFVWSQAINQSVQRIFTELENANPYWIKEIRETAKNDGGEPTSEVIDIFNNLLSEALIQDKTIRTSLNEYDCNERGGDDESIAKLYRRIYYSILTNESPIMTGDIFQFGENEFGILITPECDLSNNMKEVPKDIYEFLIIDRAKSEDYQNQRKEKFKKKDGAPQQREIFNNKVLSRHILPTFPFCENDYTKLAIIDFCNAFRSYGKNDAIVQKAKRVYKLNAPYIHQLRQRFVAFFGKYGVPAIPQSLRDYNLK
ncbi:MAG: hypothetical protein KBT27_06735 [Prevotellaceae bacterium]|nr:hypothetical protein [Candidatus Faecinaster equi]